MCSAHIHSIHTQHTYIHSTQHTRCAQHTYIPYTHSTHTYCMVSAHIHSIHAQHTYVAQVQKQHAALGPGKSTDSQAELVLSICCGLSAGTGMMCLHVVAPEANSGVTSLAELAAGRVSSMLLDQCEVLHQQMLRTGNWITLALCA